ncbi:MAG: DUF1350 family protein [Cyanophyceae cyanobacterium]
MDWQEIYGCWVLVPQQPIGIVHFLGGAFVATAPQITYRWLLEQLGKEGYVVIATPFVNTLDHRAIARTVFNRFEAVLERVQSRNLLGQRYLPVYGVGHSMGCKLHLLMASIYPVERAGNILISFNNYPARRAIPFVEQLEINPAFNVEFTPSPLETNELIAKHYSVPRNLLIQFNSDTIDQTTRLHAVLQTRFDHMVVLLKLPGNHLTPLNQDVEWQTGDSYTPLDAIGQWFKAGLTRDLRHLKQEMIRWLKPIPSI